MTTSVLAHSEIERLVKSFKDKRTEKPADDDIVQLVEKMLALQKERQSVRAEEDLDKVRTLERQIAQTDEEIDRRVYILYGLSPDEIKIVEGKE
jgi:hypothetical protein